VNKMAVPSLQKNGMHAYTSSTFSLIFSYNNILKAALDVA